MKKILSIVLAGALGPLAVVAAEPPSLVINDAWVRALPTGQPNTAAYMTLTNEGAATVTIVGASAAIAERVEIHTTREVDGLQRMEQLTQLQVAPGQSVAFAPGGTHLMLLGLERMPSPGEQARLCLQARDGAQVCAMAAVRKSAGKSQSHEHHHH